MSPKHSIKSSKTTHHHNRRHSYQPRSVASSRSQRGRSRSRSSRRARSSSPLLRSHSRTTAAAAIPPSRFGSYSRSRTRKLRHRHVPIYVPQNEQHTHAIPKIIAEALRQQGQDYNEAVKTTNLSNRLPTPPPEPNPNTQEASRAPTPGLKRRPSSSPAAAKARRRRRRRPRLPQQSVPSDGDEPIIPPQPEPTPMFPPQPHSFFGIIRAKAEKEKREEVTKRKREEERRKKRKQAEDAKKRQGGGAGEGISPKATKTPPADDASIPLPRRSNSAPPPLNRSPVYEGEQPEDYQQQDEQPRTASQRRHYRNNLKHGGKQQQQTPPRRKKHHHRPGERDHRRQKRRSSRYAMRDFFASLRRKLGNFFRLTLPAAPTPPPAPPIDYSTTPMREPGVQNYRSDGKGGGGVGGDGSEQQWRGRKRRTQLPQSHPPPYFMHGGRSPADSWHSKLSKPRSTRRFTATVESTPGSRAASPRTRPRVARGGIGVPGSGPGPGPPRFSQQSSGSTISIIARRFMGPFLSEPNSEATTVLDGGGNSVLGQRRLSWRSYKLLTTGSRPATPPSSRNVSPDGRGRSQEQVPIPGAYRSSSTSMGLRDLYGASSPEPDRRARSASPPYRVASPEYDGLADMFATPQRVASPLGNNSPMSSSPLSNTPLSSSPLGSAYVRISSPDYGLQRLFATPPAGSGTGSNFGLRRLFGE